MAVAGLLAGAGGQGGCGGPGPRAALDDAGGGSAGAGDGGATSTDAATDAGAGAPDAAIDAGSDAGAADSGVVLSLISASPSVATDGVPVRVVAVASQPVASATLTVGGRAATLVSGGTNLAFTFTATAALDHEGDQPLLLSAGGPTAALSSALFFDFSPLPGEPGDGGQSVLTRSGSGARTGAAVSETALTPAAVASGAFGKLASLPVDGPVFAQPLFVETSGLVVVATEHNSVYAFSGQAQAWQTNLGPAMPFGLIGNDCIDIVPEIGITATPVIDAASGTVYAVAKTKDADGVHLRLHALSLATGAEIASVALDAHTPAPGGGTEAFDSLKQHSRAALLLEAGVVYVALGSHCDEPPYHGWMLAYDAHTLAQVASWNATRGGTEGGIWQSGQGPASDGSGSIYVATGNGSFGSGALGGSVIALTRSLEVKDSFTPFDQVDLSAKDLDLGSTGALLIPGGELLTAASKVGKLYLLARAGLGGFHAGSDAQIVQSLSVSSGGVYGGPVYWNGSLYLQAQDDVPSAFHLYRGRFLERASSKGSVAAPFPGGALTVSAEGSRAGSAVVWALTRSGPDGVLRAYDARDLSRELWNSEANQARDAVGAFVKFAPPTVAKGRVYVPTAAGAVQIYGLR